MRLPLPHLPLLIALCAVPTLVACDGENGVTISSTSTNRDEKGVLKVVDALQCPETLGVLTRKGSANAGGNMCSYTGPRGAEVSLHLVSLEDETAEAALGRFEDQLAGSMPVTVAALKASRDMTAAGAIETEAAAGSADSASVRAPGVSVQTEGEQARIDVPGLRIDANGDKASIRIGGLSIDADDAGSSVNVSSGDESLSVQAHDDAAEIRTTAPGDAVRRTYLLTDSRPAEAGWRTVGLEARGPAGGPIVVATLRAKERDNDAVMEAAKDLVTLNVGE